MNSFLNQKWYTEILKIIDRKWNIDTKKVTKIFWCTKNKNESNYRAGDAGCETLPLRWKEQRYFWKKSSG